MTSKIKFDCTPFILSKKIENSKCFYGKIKNVIYITSVENIYCGFRKESIYEYIETCCNRKHRHAFLITRFHRRLRIML